MHERIPAKAVVLLSNTRKLRTF